MTHCHQNLKSVITKLDNQYFAVNKEWLNFSKHYVSLYPDQFLLKI